MSHHYSGPDYAFPHGDARLNFTDLYVFPKPGDAAKTIFIVNVHPQVGFNPPGPTTTDPFSREALYEVMIDSDEDNVVDIAYSVRFNSNGRAAVRRIESRNAERVDNEGELVIEGAQVSNGADTQVASAGDYRFFAGWRSDPFFFDPIGALNNLTFNGKDFFIDKNICSIVLEVPNRALGSRKLRVWARTVDGTSGTWIQADRGARASQEPFLAGDAKNAYLAGQPADDERFVPVFAHALEHAGGYTPEDAARVAATLLPDVMQYQPGVPASYPSNGRALNDDAGANFINILSNGKVSGDGLKPHSDLLEDFPYVGPPHK